MRRPLGGRPHVGLGAQRWAPREPCASAHLLLFSRPLAQGPGTGLGQRGRIIHQQRPSQYGTETVTTAIDTLSGGISINPDGSYAWNSTQEDRVIEGQWVATGNAEYPIRLLGGEDGRDWLVGSGRDTDISVWDGDTIYKEGHLVS